MQKRSRTKYAKKPVGFLIFVLIILIGVVFVQISNLYEKNIELEKEQARIEAEILKELDEQNKLLEYKEYMKSPEYIEDVARDKLGLIKPNEKLYIIKED